MLDIQTRSLFPKFLFRDKDGNALIAAIEAALMYANEHVFDGIACILDPEQMPEWRLDEMAWELGCLYDYGADVATKRDWIRNAIPYYSILGTPDAIHRYLDGVFGFVRVSEAWEYDGDPFHFAVIAGEPKRVVSPDWVIGAIRRAANVRSVLDGFAAGGEDRIGIGETDDFYDMAMPHASGLFYAGTGHLTDDLY